MCAVLEYTNRNGFRNERVWKPSNESRFSALIKCFIQYYGEKNMRIIEKPSTRPATFNECYRFAQKLKAEYGSDLKELIIWNMDKLKEYQQCL